MACNIRVLMISWLVSSGITATAADPAPDTLAEEIFTVHRDRWDAISHLVAQYRQDYYDDEFANRFTIDFTNDGRRIYISERIGGETVGPHWESGPSKNIDDGKRRFSVRTFGDGTVESVRIEPIQGDATHYQGMMDQFLWLILPGGRPIHTHLEEGARLEIEQGDDGAPVVRLVSTHRGNDLVIDLDRAHGWMPRRYTLGDHQEEVATEFQRFNGFWFPVRGHAIRDPKPGKTHFSVENIRVNSPIDDRLYQVDLDALPSGTLIRDQVRGRVWIKGTREDRERRIEENMPDRDDGQQSTHLEQDRRDLSRKLPLLFATVLSLLGIGVILVSTRHARC